MSCPPEILASIFGPPPEDVKPGTEPLPNLVPSDSSRPYVTLTFAQSIDAKIAGAGGKQLILSGEESMRMTHWMRTMHDGIMIGIGTAMNDNPQLNVRHLPFPAQNTHFQHYHHPRPLILDPHLRLSPTCKLIINATKGAGVAPWVISATPPEIEGFFANEDDGEKRKQWEARRDVLQAAGVTIILVEPESIHPGLPPATSDLPLPAVLRTLREKGIRSVMVEGGARVIQSFLASRHLVDSMIVTIAPVFLGRGSVGYGGGLEDVPGLKYVSTEVLGRDTVVGLKVTS